ncbi:MAG: peptide deformylase [Bacteroidia bacterium]
MILPIVAYGDPVLRQKGKTITKDFPKLEQLIQNMFETMDNADGIGLAAQQVGYPIMLFITGADALGEGFEDFRKVFINAEIEEEGEPWEKEEGCLSIPKIHEYVSRPRKLTIRYYDENFEFHEEQYDGMKARIIQHEYDHNIGRMFVDHLSDFKRTLLKGKLNDISKGKIDVDYRMRFPVSRK